MKVLSYIHSNLKKEDRKKIPRGSFPATYMYGYLIMISNPKELNTGSQLYVQDDFVSLGCSILVGFFVFSPPSPNFSTWESVIFGM